MKTTVLYCLPWLANKLTDKELSELDNYVDESIEDAIDSLNWYDIEYRFGNEISSIVDDAIDEYAEYVLKRPRECDAWKYHNDHGHLGSIEMCKDEVCVMVSDLLNALDEV